MQFGKEGTECYFALKSWLDSRLATCGHQYGRLGVGAGRGVWWSAG